MRRGRLELSAFIRLRLFVTSGLQPAFFRVARPEQDAKGVANTEITPFEDSGRATRTRRITSDDVLARFASRLTEGGTGHDPHLPGLQRHHAA